MYPTHITLILTADCIVTYILLHTFAFLSDGITEIENLDKRWSYLVYFIKMFWQF